MVFCGVSLSLANWQQYRAGSPKELQLCQIFLKYYKLLIFFKIIQLECSGRSAQYPASQAKQDFELLLTDCRLRQFTGL